MAQTMTPPVIEVVGMTDGQINKAVAILRAQLEKHRNELPSAAVQEALRLSTLPHELLAVVRQHVEAVADTIIRRVKVNRGQTPQQMLDATDRTQHTTASVVASMPRGSGEEVDVYFFRLGRFVTDDELAQEYEHRGLVPDQYAQGQVNKKDSVFADKYPNGSHWKDADGNWCYFAFRRWYVRRVVHVRRRGGVWGGAWWFAGVRK